MKKYSFITVTRFIFLFVLMPCLTKAQYVSGDFCSNTSGRWTNLSTWVVFNGMSWLPATTLPDSTRNVYITNGKTVYVSGSGLMVKCKNLKVEANAWLIDSLNGISSNIIRVYGSSLICNGTIGDPFFPSTFFPYFIFEFEGPSCTISGSGGQFRVKQIRKSTAYSPVTNLTISRNLDLMNDYYNNFGGGIKALYNNAANTNFNVTISAGAQVAHRDGIICIDGGTGEKGGTFVVDGTLWLSMYSSFVFFPGIPSIQWTTDNTNPAYACNWIINGLVETTTIASGTCGAAVHNVALNNNSQLLIRGQWQLTDTTCNRYAFKDGSTVKYLNYSGSNASVISSAQLGNGIFQSYYNLVLDGNLAVGGNLYVRNDLIVRGGGTSVVPAPGFLTFNAHVSGNLFDSANTIYSSMHCDTLFFTGSTTQYVNFMMGNFIPEKFMHLCLNKSAFSSVVFNCPVEANGSVSFKADGYIDLNGKTLTLNTAPWYTFAGFSPMRFIKAEHTAFQSKVVFKYLGTTIGTYTVPFGKPGMGYCPLIITTNGNNVGEITVSTYGTLQDNQPWPSAPVAVTNLAGYSGLSPDNRNATVDRFWLISSSVVNPSGLNISFGYPTGELPVAPYQNPAQLYAQRWEPGIGQWTGQTGMPLANAVSVSNTATGIWTLASQLSPLPITLISFEGTVEDKFALLKWETESELNNHFFTIEKSLNGMDYHPVGTVSGAGNSTALLKYSYLDSEPLSGTVYYRLRQTDFNGGSTRSKTIALHHENNPSVNIRIFPNPVINDITVSFTLNQPDRVKISLHDVFGNELTGWQKEFKGQGKEEFKVSLAGSGMSYLPEGIYFLKMQGELTTATERIIINHP